MSVPHSTCACLRRALPSLLGGLLLFAATFGCSGRKEDGDKTPPPEKTSTPEPVAKPDDTEPVEAASNQKPPTTIFIPAARPEATFMGTRATGKRFCIIADASNSMQGRPLVQLKKEILRTLDGLAAGSEFYVIFFHATDVSMPHSTWLPAGKENVDKIRPWVQNMTTILKTLPKSAFERAFKLDPKPDVIFFMTDGFLQGKNPDPVTHVSRLNAKDAKVIVHTIMFSKQKQGAAKLAAASQQLRNMAENNGGTFRHVTAKD